ncbi:MAG TPA: TatD family hydrolase [Candidatus Methylomirabilis sp.]|jgi:predicted metal-dependent TIM-barrel fold hydrolase|nr:TatD family hydrolase [Candidatus Methylomirabilis sp.]
MIPYIDSHCHSHVLPHDAWEDLSMTGMVACVISAGNPAVYREVLTEPPGPAEIRRCWDHPIHFARLSERRHFVRVFVAVGVPSVTAVREWARLVEVLPEVAKDPAVVAIGEIGLDPVQHFGLTWPMADQEACFAAQVELAKALDLPLILHTSSPRRPGEQIPKRGPDLPPVERHRLHYLERDMAIINTIGLDHARLIVDHVDDSIIEYVHKETGAWAGISTGSLQRPIAPTAVADMVTRYGPDRILLNSDHVGYRGIDLFAVPKALRELRRRGLSDLDLRRVAFANANHALRLGLPDPS